MDMGFSDSRNASPGDAAPALQPLGWSDLCARLVAAQHLAAQDLAMQDHHAATAPQAPRKQSGTRLGSFHSAAAVLVARYRTMEVARYRTMEVAHTSALQVAHTSAVQGFVNPTSSGNRKDTSGTPFVSNAIPLTRCFAHQADETCHD